MKRLCSYKVNFNFISILIETNILELSYIFGENPGTNQNFKALHHDDLLYCTVLQGVPSQKTIFKTL